MTSKQVFRGTMPFIMAKLALGGVMVLVSALLLAILMGIGWLFGDGGIFVGILIWCGCIGGIRFALMHYVGYLLKAGHIAVIAEAFKTGQIPANQVEYGKNMVKERFLTTNVYLAIDKLISAAIKEIQKVIDKAGNALDFIPGMDSLASAAKFFVDISLGYVDECCLAWTFYNQEQSAFESAADGVVIYAQNWKALLKNAAMTMLKTVVLLVVLTLLIFVPIGLLFKVLKWSGFAAFILACLVAYVVKFAVMDSYIMIQMMSTYMQVAPTTVITFDLYGKLCNMSKKFKEMFYRGKEEAEAAGKVAYAGAVQAGAGVAQAGTVAGARPMNQTMGQQMNAGPVQTQQAAGPVVTPQAPAVGKPIFCGHCDAKNDAGTKFCGSCGAKLGN